MYLNEFLDAGNRLFMNTRDLFDAELLNKRFRAIYSTRTMRIDFTAEQIAATGQNVIDCNQSLLKQLFEYAENFNPEHVNQTTTTKTGNNSDVITDDTTHTNTGTTTTDSNLTDTPNNSVATTKSAYNATEQKPAETTTTTGTNSAVQKITNTNDLTETNSRDYTKHNDFSETSSTYGVSGADEIRAAFEKFIAPYDYLAKIIAAEVCELVW